MSLPALLAVAAGLLWLAVAVASFRVYRSVPKLRPADPLPDVRPRVGVVVPARDEEDCIEACVRSLLAQEGVELDLVVVDDGSTDGTGAILDRLAAEDPRLEVVHGPPLPDGWLGKVHALHLGASRVRGDWLLFADADVRMHPRAVASALGLAARDGRELVALMPRFEWETAFEHALMVALMIALVQAGSPRLEDPAHPEDGAGSGSFTLVARAAYERAGGHAPLRSAVLDDIELGRLVKRAGARVAFRMAPELVRIRMYRGNRAAFWGLAKNVVASFEGRVGPALAAGALVALMLLGPPAALAWGALSAAPLACGAGAGVYLLQLATLAAMRPWHRYRWSRLPAFPLFAFSAVACLFAGSHRALRRGTVRWKGRDVAVGKAGGRGPRSAA